MRGCDEPAGSQPRRVVPQQLCQAQVSALQHCVPSRNATVRLVMDHIKIFDSLGPVSLHTSVRLTVKNLLVCMEFAFLSHMDFREKKYIFAKLHGLCCLLIRQRVRSCGTAWYWLFIHMVIHKPCTTLVDTNREGGDVRPRCRLFPHAASCGRW